MAEATTVHVDVEALRVTAGGLAGLSLPTSVGLPSRGAAGDEVLDAALREFCRRYNQLVDDTAGDHGAAIGHLRGTANDYTASEAAITSSLLIGGLTPAVALDPTTPPAPPDPATPELAQPARG